jgi:hypothetical protein
MKSEMEYYNSAESSLYDRLRSERADAFKRALAYARWGEVMKKGLEGFVCLYGNSEGGRMAINILTEAERVYEEEINK